MKRTISKLLATILMLALVFGLQPGLDGSSVAYAADTDYGLIFDVSEGKFFLADGADTEYTGQADKWSWDAVTNTLTLTNFVWETPAEYALLINGNNITLNIVGVNSFISTYSGTDYSAGIFTYGKIIITGSGTLFAQGGTSDNMSSGISADYLTINGGAVTAIGGRAAYSAGIECLELVVSEGSLETVGGMADELSGGVFAYDILAIYGGELTATAGSAPESIAISAEYNIITISGGTVTATGETSAFYKAPDTLPTAYNWFASETLPYTPSGTGTQSSDAAYVWSAAQKFVEIQSANVPSPSDYGLVFDGSTGKFWLDVNGDQAVGGGDTEYTKGKGTTWSWNGETEILTLTDFVFETPAAYALVIDDDITLNIVGVNSFVSTYAGTPYGTSVETTGIDAKTLTIKGSGSLVAKGGESITSESRGMDITYLTINSGTVIAMGGSGLYSTGIDCLDLIINGGSIEAVGGMAEDESSGIYAYEILAIFGGDLTATAGSAPESVAINTYGSYSTLAIMIMGGTVTATGETGALKIAPDTLPTIYSWFASETLPYTPSGTGTQSSDAAYVWSAAQKFVEIQSTTLSTNFGLIFNAWEGEFWLDVDGDRGIGGIDIQYTDGEGTTWEWDELTSTLTLTDFEWETPAEYALTIIGNVTIELVGTNSFTSTYIGADSTAGISGYSEIIIGGSGTLLAKGGETNSVSFESTGLSVGSLTIKSGTVTAIGGSGYYSSGISCFDFAINGGSVEAVGGIADAESNGLLSYYNITISGGYLTAIAGSAPNSTSIATGYGDITISGGTVTATGETSALNIAPDTLPTAYNWFAIETLPYTPSGDGTKSSDAAYVWSAAQKFVKVQTTILSTNFGLIFSAADGKFYVDISGNGNPAEPGNFEYDGQAANWSWDAGTSTLTLTDFEWETPAKYALLIIGDITLNIVGSNSFISTCSSGESVSRGIYADRLIITGTGDLFAKGGAANTESNGLYGNDIVIESGSVTAVGGTGGRFSAGFRSFNFTLTGGSLVAVGDIADEESNGLYINSTITISDGSLTATAGNAPASIAVSGDSYNIGLNGGTVTATGGTSAFKKAPDTLPATYNWFVSETLPYTPSGTGTKSSDAAYVWSSVQKFVKVQTTTPPSSTNYGLIFDVAEGKFFLGDGNLGAAGTEYTGQADKWSWDAGTKTLTLTDFVWETTAYLALEINGDITLNLVGSNRITAKNDGSGESIGLSAATHSLTITGSGSLLAEGGYSLNVISVGIVAKSFTINSGTVSAVGDDQGRRSMGIKCAEFLMTGGSVEAIGSTAGEESNGIFADNTVTISGGNLVASGGSAPNSIGIYASAYDIAITGGTVTATGETSAFKKAPNTLPAAYYWFASETLPYTPSGTGTYSVDAAYIWSAAQKYVKIESTTLLDTIGHALIFDVATGKFYEDIDNDADPTNPNNIVYTGQSDKWSWSNGVLTLNGFSYSTTGFNALIIVGGDLTINLYGANTFEVPEAPDDGITSGITMYDGNLTIKGDGTLNTKGGSSAIYTDIVSAGIMVDGTLKIESGTVNGTGGDVKGSSLGVTVEAYIQSGGVLNAKGGAAEFSSIGLEVIDDITLSGGTLNATGGTAEYSCGIYNCYEEIDCTLTASGGTINATGASGVDYSDGIYTVNLKISGGTVNATAGASTEESFGVYAEENITISGGTLTTFAGASKKSYGASFGEKLAITGSTLVASGHTGAINKAPDVSALSTYTFWTNTAVTAPGGDGTKAESAAYSWNANQKYIKITTVVTPTTSSTSTPKTGDNSNIYVLSISALLSIFGIMGLVGWRKRRISAQTK